MGTLHIVALAAILSVTTAALPATHEKEKKHDLSCQDFSKGVFFNDSQAIGVWHLLHNHFNHEEKHEGATGGYCVQFSVLAPEERKVLSELVSKYVENLKWENLALKMQIPCDMVKLNKTRLYYLERLDKAGSYRTLEMPSSNAKLDLAEFHRYPLRFKPIEGGYLAMMDCHEKIVFLLGKQTPSGQLDERLKKIISVYWPAE